MKCVALTIAGSDPSGGAGIQADLKTFHQFGVYGEAVITLLTVQNTRTVSRVACVSPDLVIRADRSRARRHPAACREAWRFRRTPELWKPWLHCAAGFTFPLVVDPVMISKHGAPC